MHTQCPNCHAVFRISAPQLEQADGWVRCGQCHTLFNGKEYLNFLSTNKIISASAGSSRSDSDPDKDISKQLTKLVKKRLEQKHDEDVVDPTQESPPIKQRVTTDEFVESKEIPSLLQQDLDINTHSRPHNRSMSVTFAVGITVSMLLLIFQHIYFNRDEFSKNPTLNELVANLCKIVGCEVTPYRDVSQIDIVNRNIFTHPNVSNALLVTATVANSAPLPQVYPGMEVKLTNLQGKIIATRRFRPEEYLGQHHNTEKLMQPGQSENIKLEVTDPGGETLAFEFDFF